MNNNDKHQQQQPLPNPQGINIGKSKRLCKSWLNPNAPEFIPSSFRCGGDSVNSSSNLTSNELDSSLQLQMEQKTESSTTLVNPEELVGEATMPQKRSEAQIRHIQRQMFNLLKHMGNNQNLPLAQIQFSLAANGQGVSVQFMMPDTTKAISAVGKQKLDADACQAAIVRLDVGQKPSKGQALIMPFLSRMSEIITRSQNELKMEKPSTCSRCIPVPVPVPVPVPKEKSYTELEIEQQIEDIKAFEKLTTDNGGRCYQDAFKELCDKLGLVTQDKQLKYFGCCVHGAGAGTGSGGSAAELRINQMTSRNPKPNQFPKLNTNTKLDDENQSSDEEKCIKDFNSDDVDSSPYDWDTFTTDFETMKTYYANAGRSAVHVNKRIDSPRERRQQVLPPPSEEFPLNLPPSSSNMSKSKANVNSSYPKLFRVNQTKCNNLQVAGRKASLHKEKERWRHNLQGRSTPVGAVTKSTGDSLYSSNHRTKSHPREGQTKSAQNRTHLTELTRSQLVEAAANCKVIKPHSELVQV